jgi:tetratricopeptide (TPR) repeat protein
MQMLPLLLAATILAQQPAAPAQPAPQQPPAAPAPAEVDRNDPPSLLAAGRALVDGGKVEEALPLFKRGLELRPDSYDLNLAMGNALDVQGKGSKARGYLTHAFEIAPPDSRVQAMVALAVSFVFDGKIKEAATLYQQIYDKQMGGAAFGAAAGTANALGRVYVESGDLVNGRRWYQTGYEASRRLPDLPESQLPLWEFRWIHAQARLAARAGHLDDARRQVAAARQLLDSTADLKAQLPFWFYLAGYVELLGKQYDAAIAQLQQGDANDPFVLMLLARAQQGAGKKDEARATWEKILDSGAHNLQNAFARPAARKALGR